MRVCRVPIALLAVAAASAAALADPPNLEIPATVQAPPDGYLILQPKTDAASVVYVSPGLSPFPAQFLNDKTAFIVPVGGVTQGSYTVYAVGASKTGEQKLVKFQAVFGSAPPPQPPGPGPTPAPPGPNPPPGPVTSFRVVLIYESSATYPAAVSSVLYGKDLEAFLSARTTRDGVYAGFRRHDKDDAAAGDTATFNALWGAVKPKVTAVPCIAVEVNGKVTIEPLPASPAEAVAFLKGYIGEK